MRSDYLDDKQAPKGRGGADKKAPRGLGCKTVVVTTLVVLGVVVTVALMKLVVGWATGPEEDNQRSELESLVGQQLAREQDRFEVDRDGDGLTDLLENIYGSDPEVADTDGDGTNDGDEVAEGRDPTIPGPNDVFDLEAGEDLLETESYSQRYVATLPADVSREELLDEERITAFITEIRGELLPPVDESSIRVSGAADAEAVGAYLDTISPNTNEAMALVTNEDIDAAFRSHYQLGQSEELEGIIADLEGNVAILEEVVVPQPALELHTKLLAASRALVSNVKLLERMREDLIGGLLGAKNIEDLGPVFGEIADMVAELEAEYNLE